jgi:molecular chaperone DnaK
MPPAAKRPDPVVGIDLGTTYSVVAHLEDDGRPATIPNKHGELLTPSVVLFEEDSLVVGKEAARRALVEPERVADCAKRDMGRPFYHRPVAGRQVTPEMISAVILKALKAEAEDRVGPIRRAVITVPAYFDHGRREATVRAGELAGLEVLDILNEPTAAALAYGWRERFLDPTGALSARATARPGALTVVVYDLGGGTFDVTVMQIRDRAFKTLATDGDVRLGGRDWDQRLVDHAARAFLAEHPGDDPRQDPETNQALLQAAEQAKRTLSERPKGRLVYAHRGLRAGLEVTREQFDELTADLLERTRATTALVLREAGLAWDEVDKLLLVGGSTRMPQVVRMLRELSGQEPDHSVSADEAVAHGAAIYHGILLARLGERPGPDGGTAEIVNVNSHSLGVVAMARSAGRLCNSILIPRNTPLPHAGSQRFRTLKPGQRRIVVRLVEGEAVDPDDCIPIGEFEVGPLPPGIPEGSPVRVTYRYDVSGRIRVEAKLEAYNASARTQIVRKRPKVDEAVEAWALKLLGALDEDEDDEDGPA